MNGNNPSRAHQPTADLSNLITNTMQTAVVGMSKSSATDAADERYHRTVDQPVIDRFRGRWIAVADDESVVANGSSLTGLNDALCDMPNLDVTIWRVPAADEPLFVGLG
jgi:hypothetical protein